jgi:phage-related minor tail protein
VATELAVGYVSLEAETSKLPKQLSAAFQSAGKAAGKQGGSEAATAFEAGMRGVTVDLAKAFGDARSAGKNAGADAANAAESSLSGISVDLSEAFGDAKSAGKNAGTEAASGFESMVSRVTRGKINLSGMFSSAGDAGEQAGGSFMSGLGDKLGELTGKGGKGGLVGATVGAAFSLAGLSAAGLFASALQSGMERQQQLDLTQARLGVDDATMAKIGTAAGRAYVNTFGESVADNAETARIAIQSGLLDESDTAQYTQSVIEQLSAVSQLMGEDIPNVARAAGQAVKTGMARDASDAMDLFVAASQNGLNVSEDLLDTVTEYGTQFRKLGLDGVEAMGLINQAVQAGARDSDVAADAIKEFSIRAVDGSDSTTKAFEDLGLNADEISHKFAEGGKSAHDATQQIFDGLRNIQDPLVRGQVAVELFGTQWEDLGAAFDQFDLSTAAESLGQVSGAAENAMNKIGGNAASSIEGAKRSIEASTDAISAALAKAFGPEIAKVADWVTQHQPEILGFFGKLADGAFATADALLGFTATGLRAFASFAEGAGTALSGITKPLGGITEAFGKLTGSKSMEDIGHGLRTLDDSLDSAASKARGLADGIDNSARPALDRLRGSVGDNIQSAQRSEEMFRALGNTVLSLPDGHTITLTDNTPETTAKLEALGLKVTTLPNGTVTVTAATEEGQKTLDAFVQTNTGRRIPMTAEVAVNAIAGDQAAKQQIQQQVGGTGNLWPTPRADGGISRGAQISNRAIIWAEAGPEAYIPLSPSKRDKSVPIWMEVGQRLGLFAAMASGGIVPGKKFAQSMDPATYQLGGFSTTAIDCSGMVSATVNDALGLPPFSSRMATGNEGEWLAAKGAKPGLGGPGDISVGWVVGGPAGGHTAMTLGDGTNVESNGSEGVVIGGPVGANSSMFDQFAHIPAALLRGGDAGAATSNGTGGGTAASGGTGGGTSASGGGLGGGTVGTGTAFDTSKVPSGVVPVWIVNSDGSSYTPTPSTGTGTPQAATAAPGTTGAAEVQTVDQAVASGRDKLTAAGQGFLKANADDALGAAGLRSSGGALQAVYEQSQSKLAQQVADIFTQRFSEIVAQAAKQIDAGRVAAVARYGR